MNTVQTKTVIAADGVVSVGDSDNAKVTDIAARQLLIEILEQLKIMNLHMSILTDHELVLEDPRK